MFLMLHELKIQCWNKRENPKKDFTLFVWKIRSRARTKLLILIIHNHNKTFLGVYAGYINILD